MRKLALPLIVVSCLTASAVGAGPPLLSDDPHTVGPGNVDAIISMSAISFGESAALVAPTLDVTLGLFEGLDLTAVVAPSFAFADRAHVETSGVFEVGLKWQPIRGEHWNASFTPAVGTYVPFVSELTVTLPVQIEYAWSRFALGVDGGYAVEVSAADAWFVAGYGSFSLVDRLTLLGEVWGGQARHGTDPVAGFNFGLDWAFADGLDLLVAGGPGFAFAGERNPCGYMYVGLEWQFSAWTSK